VNIESGAPSEHGHEHHMRAITRCARRAAEADGRKRQLRSGIMKSAIEHGVEVVLAGSIRDDGPLPT